MLERKFLNAAKRKGTGNESEKVKQSPGFNLKEVAAYSLSEAKHTLL